jgi:hypothetical protein
METVASNFGCVGLHVEDVDDLERLLGRVLPIAVEIGRVGDVVVWRWQDASGSRLTLSTRGPELLDVLPSFAANSGAALSSMEFLADGVASAAVLDENGEQLTAMTLELEGHRLFEAEGAPTAGDTAITALGVEVEVYASADEFIMSDASLLSPPSNDDEPPANVAELVMQWPPRVGPNSFLSYGIWGDPAAATAHARLAGIVLDARSHTVELTGRSFIEARVRSVFDAHVCFPADELELPLAGNVVHGTVFLVGSMALPIAPAGRRRWGRSR